jgi:ABC-type sugar transport system permease subunit
MGYGSSIAISLAVIILVLTLFQFVVNRRRNEVEY